MIDRRTCNEKWFEFYAIDAVNTDGSAEIHSDECSRKYDMD
jgi:hypothetical protein